MAVLLVLLPLARVVAVQLAAATQYMHMLIIRIDVDGNLSSIYARDRWASNDPIVTIRA